MEAFAQAIRRLRHERGYTVDQLAERAGLTGGEISRVERGEREPRLSTIVQLAQALEVGVDELFGERERAGPARGADPRDAAHDRRDA